MPVTKTEKTVQISLPSGAASAEIYYYGANLTSWKVAGEEKIFLSSKAILDGSKAIRGGIPICWPIFGPPPSASSDSALEAHSKLPQHGFARTHVWELEKVVMDRDEGVSVRFSVNPTGEIKNIFPHAFSLAYVVTLTAHELSTDLHVINPSSASEPLKFQALLHTYLAVEDSKKIKIKGLKEGLTYIDKVKGQTKETWEGGDLMITQEVDRVYQGVGDEDLFLEDGSKTTKVHRRGFPDCTTWNPQVGTGSKMADMEANGWDRYVCIEPGYVKEFKALAPGEEWIGQQVLKVSA